MTKFKKTVQHLTAAELAVESKKLVELILQAKVAKIAGRAKNLRETFILRKKLAIVKAYENLHR